MAETAPKYAAGTTVSAERSEAELKALLRRHGAERIMVYEDAERVVVMFERRGRRVRLILPLPAPEAFRYTPTRLRRTDQATRNAWQDEIRRRWRAFIPLLKGKFEAEATGLTTFEREWLAFFVLPDGATIGERLEPALDEVTTTGALPPLLPGSTAGTGPILLPARASGE